MKVNSNNPKEIHALIRRIWCKWIQYKEREQELRELQLEQKISKADKADDKKGCSHKEDEIYRTNKENAS